MAIGDFSVHPSFKIKGSWATTKELREISHDLIKEGEGHEVAIGTFLLDWLDDRSTVEVRTSGSTGTPKPILLKKECMANSARATGRYFGLRAGDRALLCLPADYIAGKMMLVRAMVLGLELDYVAPSSRPLFGLSRKYHFAAMVPLQLENSLLELPSIETLIVGGAPIPKALVQKVQGLSTKIFETYGMTETITHIAVKGVNAHPEHTITHFVVLPGVDISKDPRECLIVDAPGITEGPVVTNDLVNLICQTEFEWLGRLDNVINSGGIKISPEILEGKMAPMISNRFFVTGLPDPVLGQKLVLIIEGKLSTGSVLAQLDKVRTLQKFEIPKEVYPIPKFVETANGKVDRPATLRIIS
jgi:O-succinylbenzoic acid--CoA ligase